MHKKLENFSLYISHQSGSNKTHQPFQVLQTTLESDAGLLLVFHFDNLLLEEDSW